jgi:hypothetical protein
MVHRSADAERVNEFQRTGTGTGLAVSILKGRLGERGTQLPVSPLVY